MVTAHRQSLCASPSVITLCRSGRTATRLVLSADGRRSGQGRGRHFAGPGAQPALLDHCEARKPETYGAVGDTRISEQEPITTQDKGECAAYLTASGRLEWSRSVRTELSSLPGGGQDDGSSRPVVHVTTNAYGREVRPEPELGDPAGG